MRKTFAVTLLLIVFSSFFLHTFSTVRAHSGEHSRVEYIVEEDETINDDVLAGADSITIAGTINGDVYAIAENISVTGTINGDVYVLGGTIEVTGTVRDDVVALGGTVNVKNVTIGDSLISVGGTVSVQEDVTIDGAHLFAGGTVINNATIERGMYGAAGSLDFNGSTARNAWVYTGVFTAGEGSSVGGDLSYSMQQETDLPSALTVAGAVKYIDPNSLPREWGDHPDSTLGQKINFGYHLWSFSSALLIGLLFLYLFPDVTKNVALTIKEKMPASIGWGIVVFVGILPVFILLCMTVVGIPLGLLVMGAFMLEMYFAKIFVGFLYGLMLRDSVLKNPSMNKSILFVLGLGVFYVIALIPYINILQTIGSIIVTLGAVFLVKRDRFVYRVHEK